VLEIGCGTGCDLLQFAKNGAIATGVDITDEHLRLAQNRVGNLAQVRRSDGRELPFPNASFDYVYSHGVIHHCHEPEKIAAEILRVLKPGGRFNIHLYALLSLKPLWELLLHGKKWRDYIENPPGPVHVDLYTKARIRRLFPGCEIQFSKYHARYMQWAAPWIGWFLVAKGQRPSAVGSIRFIGK
jgi:SAM-dependent methyltransferase